MATKADFTYLINLINIIAQEAGTSKEAGIKAELDAVNSVAKKIGIPKERIVVFLIRLLVKAVEVKDSCISKVALGEISSVAKEAGIPKEGVIQLLQAVAGVSIRDLLEEEEVKKWLANLKKENDEETISEADLTELVDFIKECVAEVKNKLVTANQKMDRLLKERAEFWQKIEEVKKEIAKYAHR